MKHKRTVKYILITALAVGCGLAIYALVPPRGSGPDAALTAALIALESATTAELTELTAELGTPMLKVIVPTALAHDGWLLRQANINAINRARREAQIPASAAAILNHERQEVEALIAQSRNFETENKGQALIFLNDVQGTYFNHIEQSYSARIGYLLAIGELAANLNTVVGYFRVEDDTLIFEQSSLQFTYMNNLNAIEAQASEMENLAQHLQDLALTRSAYPARITAILAE